LDYNCRRPWLGWLAGVSGHTGFHGVNPYVNVGIGQILKHVNAIFSFAGEARKGRFGLLGDLLYLNGQASSFSDLGFHGVSFTPRCARNDWARKAASVGLALCPLMTTPIPSSCSALFDIGIASCTPGFKNVWV